MKLKFFSLCIVLALFFGSVLPPIPFTGKTTREIVTMDEYHNFNWVVIQPHTPIMVTDHIFGNLCFAEWYTKDIVDPILHGGRIPCDAVLPYVKSWR